MKSILLIVFLSLVSQQIYAQRFFQDRQYFRKTPTKEKTIFNYKPKKTGHYSAEQWQEVIDSTWGPGLPTEEKLAIFDEAWNKIDDQFAAFQDIDVDWDAQYNRYRPEIEAGVSAGRFAAIMSYMTMALEEYHTYALNYPLMINTPLKAGVPLLYLGGNADNVSHFGASLTPLPDSSLLVLNTISQHPIGLEPGDIILGYDGRLWKELLTELMSYQLPIFLGYSIPGGDNISNKHNLLCGAGQNWHLFDTLDVVKYSSADTVHFPTSALEGLEEPLFGAEQLPVPGVDWIYTDLTNEPDPSALNDFFNWGKVKDTNIGYIYALAWTDNDLTPDQNISQEFYNAIYNLMFVEKADGIIIDQRLNYGGRWVFQEGLSLLFNETVSFYSFRQRCSTVDHYAMCQFSYFDSYAIVNGSPTSFFDHPIAVLTGPAAVSCGDAFPATMRKHPMVRIFGKPTNGSFSTITNKYALAGYDDWHMAHTQSNGFLYKDPENYLSHHAIIPDEEIWLSREDVANGEDTVVKRALEWIRNLSHAHDVSVDKSYAVPDTDLVNINTIVENPDGHMLSVSALIKSSDSIVNDTISLFNDGMHGDSTADDKVWGNKYMPKNEQTFKISIITTDLVSETSRVIPNIARFSTIGPISLRDTAYVIAHYDSANRIQFIYLQVQNEGKNVTAEELSVTINTEDARVAEMVEKSRNIPDIPAGEMYTTDIHRYFAFRYAEGYGPQSTYEDPIHFDVTISSSGFSFWKSSFEFTATIVSIENEQDILPKQYVLKQNYPNPFNPATMISYQLPMNCVVNLSIYNLLSQKVTTLIDKKQAAGTYKVQWDASQFSSGVYLYRLTAGDFVATRKLVLIK